MASSSSQQGSRSSATGSISSNANDEERPLWIYVEKISKPSVGGGNWIWKCKYCKQDKQGTYTRVKAHLLKIPNKGVAVCKKVSPGDISEMKKLEEDFATKCPPTKTVSLPCEATDSGIDDSDSSKKRKVDDTPLGKSFDVAGANMLDCHIARMFYTAGLPFSLAKNPSFIAAFIHAAKHNFKGYAPPGYNKLRTTLLELEKNWSTYSFIHSLKRNKLTPKRAEDLVFIHNNLRLLSRNTKEYAEGRSKMWDVGGDEFGSLEDTGVLEFADLSLDEPEMEGVLIEDIE